MRIPKRHFLGGVIAKAKGVGVFAPGATASGGRIGGKSRSAAKVAASRKNIAKAHANPHAFTAAEKSARGRRGGAALAARYDDPVFREMQRWNAGRFKKSEPSANPKGNPENLDPRKGMHVRWHLRRGIKNPNCPFCKKP